MPRCAGSENASRLSVVGAREMSGHRGARPGGLRDRVSDQVGERHLDRIAGCGQGAVDLTSPSVEDRHRDGPERRGRRNVAAALHVVDERRGGNSRGSARRSRPRRRALSRRSEAATVLRVEHVALGDDAPRTRAVDGAKVDAVLRSGATSRGVGIDIHRRLSSARPEARVRRAMLTSCSSGDSASRASATAGGVAACSGFRRSAARGRRSDCAAPVVQRLRGARR